MTPEKFVGPKEVVKHLGICYDRVLFLADTGMIRGYKVGAPQGRRGGRWIFKLSEVTEDIKMRFSNGFDKRGQAKKAQKG